MPSPFGVKLLNAHRVINRLLSLVPQESLLEAWEHWRLDVLKEGYYHQGKSIRA